jgi:tripartite-type tricarboxylate transporter receptor subunit TctC
MDRMIDRGRRRFTLACVLAGGALAMRRTRAAPMFPTRTVRLVVPYSVGLGPDVVARTIAGHLAQRWGQAVIVDNKPGGSGIIAFAEVPRTVPDGHTLFIGDAGTLAVNPLLHDRLPYDPTRDVAPITMLFRATLLIVVSARSRFATVAEIIGEARQRPFGISYASLGNGHPMHLAVERFATAAGIALLHVPFKEAGALMSAVANGDVDFTTLGMNAVAGMVNSGRLKVLAAGAATRLPDHPAIPTISEAGGPPTEMRPWAALVGVAGTPPLVLEKIRTDTIAAIHAPGVRSTVEGAGYEPFTSTPDDVMATMSLEARSAAALVRAGRVRRV